MTQQKPDDLRIGLEAIETRLRRIESFLAANSIEDFGNQLKRRLEEAKT
jgi:hypothetical protein